MSSEINPFEKFGTPGYYIAGLGRKNQFQFQWRGKSQSYFE